MQFTFKRDEKGHERIYVGDVCVARFITAEEDGAAHKAMHIERVACGITGPLPLGEAIERADEAGFWEHYAEVALHGCDAKWTLPNEVAVDVPVADNAVLSVTVGGDES